MARSKGLWPDPKSGFPFHQNDLRALLKVTLEVVRAAYFINGCHLQIAETFASPTRLHARVRVASLVFMLISEKCRINRKGNDLKIAACILRMWRNRPKRHYDHCISIEFVKYHENPLSWNCSPPSLVTFTLHRLGPSPFSSPMHDHGVHAVSCVLWELLCLHIQSLGQQLNWPLGAGEMRHKTTMSLPRGAGGMAVGLLSVCVLFDLNVFICLMPPTPYGEGRLGQRRGTLTNLWQLEP